MTTARKNNLMIRLDDEEAALVQANVPAGEEKAAFVRRVLLAALKGQAADEIEKRRAAFIVAAISKEIDFAEAISLYEAHVPLNKEATNGQ